MVVDVVGCSRSAECGLVCNGRQHSGCCGSGWSEWVVWWPDVEGKAVAMVVMLRVCWAMRGRPDKGLRSTGDVGSYQTVQRMWTLVEGSRGVRWGTGVAGSGCQAGESWSRGCALRFSLTLGRPRLLRMLAPPPLCYFLRFFFHAIGG